MTPPIHVLMIEDSPDDAELLTRELGRSGFAFRSRRVDSETALRDALSERDWDVVLADYTLPGLDGTSALRIAKECGSTAPIIVVSGTIGEERAVQTILEGATDYLLKDRLARLGPAVARAIEQHRMREERRRAERQEALVTSISRALIESTSLEETIERTLRALCERLGWDWSALWRIDEERGVLRCLSIWHDAALRATEFDALTRRITFRSGEGLPGRVWRFGRPEAVGDVAGDGDSERGTIATGNGMRSAFAFPIRLAGKPIGVVEMCSTTSRAPGGETIEALETIGSFVGQQVERQRAEDALRAEREMLSRRVEEQTADLSRANADLARASRLKDEFLANMSHELRTPLNAVLGLSEALLEEVYGPLTEKQRSTLMSIEDSGRHLLELISDILDLSKIEAGKLELDVQTVDAERTCKASILLVRHAAHKKRLALALEIEPGVRAVRADERRLKQILVNLLTNAVKFTPEGGSIGLDVRTSATDGHVRFEVWDTGIGIAESEMPRLCRPFVQLDSSLSRTHAGTGLGLSLVHRMAEMHGGGLAIESQVGKGSRFTVVLPGAAYESRDHERATAPSAAGNAVSVRTAVIVDDSQEAAEQLNRYLRDMSVEATICGASDAAFETIVRERPYVVFLDLLMQGIDGWAVLASLKSDPRTARIPVVLVSVVDEPKLGKSRGASGYLVKPVSRPDVARMIEIVAAGLSGAEENSAEGGRSRGEKKPAGPLVLLAEDNEFNIGVVSDYLQTCGFRMVVARNGEEAVRRARECRPDVVLMDIQMPVVDGLEAIRILRGDAKLSLVPIIALTALAMPGDRQRCLEAGADRYMSKPVGMKALRQAIESLLDRGKDPAAGLPEMTGA